MGNLPIKKLLKIDSILFLVVKMKFIFISSLVFFLCTSFYFTPAHVKAAHRLMNSFDKKMKTQGFRLSASGGAMMNDIQKIDLDYEICRYLDVSEARLLFVKHAEALLSQINNDSNIRPYLHNYPFTSKNIFLTFSFCKTNGDLVDPPYIAYVAMQTSKNKVRYLVNDEEKNKLKRVYEEPYDEALRIYKESLKN